MAWANSSALVFSLADAKAPIIVSSDATRVIIMPTSGSSGAIALARTEAFFARNMSSFPEAFSIASILEIFALANTSWPRASRLRIDARADS